MVGEEALDQLVPEGLGLGGGASSQFPMSAVPETAFLLHDSQTHSQKWRRLRASVHTVSQVERWLPIPVSLSLLLVWNDKLNTSVALQRGIFLDVG